MSTREIGSVSPTAALASHSERRSAAQLEAPVWGDEAVQKDECKVLHSGDSPFAKMICQEGLDSSDDDKAPVFKKNLRDPEDVGGIPSNVPRHCTDVNWTLAYLAYSAAALAIGVYVWPLGQPQALLRLTDWQADKCGLGANWDKPQGRPDDPAMPTAAPIATSPPTAVVAPAWQLPDATTNQMSSDATMAASRSFQVNFWATLINSYWPLLVAAGLGTLDGLGV
eukprot:Skav221921  [mRNA]  locus=scaffold5163:92608:97692:- [translate_table: standard]